MKKIISSVVAIFLAFILFTNVSAVEVSSEDISAGSYLIGTHLFDREGSSSYNGTLTVRHIMLASKTIPGNTIEDMQILYKRARDGAWLDSITNEVVEMPEKVNVEYRNLEQMLVAPTLATGLGGSLGTTDLSIIEVGAYGYEDMWNTIDGYELYEKNGEELTLVDEYEPTGVAIVTVDVGESKTYVARVFVYYNENQKVYSDYSNEYVVENTLPAPTLATGLGGSLGTMDLNIIEGGAYGYEDMWNAIDGFELYEKDGEELTLVDEYEPTGVAIVTVDVGESKTYVARVYKYNKSNKKVYSEYSNEYVVENMLETPTLFAGMGGTGFAYLSIRARGAYAEEYMWESIDGFELYEKVGDELTLVDEYEPTEDAIVTTDVGERKTFVARVFVYNASNEKVYSDYSNEHVEENMLKTPTLDAGMGGTGFAYLSITYKGTYSDEYMLSFIDGFTLYEKVEDELILVDEYEPTEDAKVTVQDGESKVYVVRVFAYNKANEKIYSGYSNDFVLAKVMEYGDVNGDDKIDIGDALLVQAYVENETELTNMQLAKADVNGDSKVNNIDVLLLLRYDAGYYPNTLPTNYITDYVLYGDLDINGIVDREDVYYLENYLSDNNTLGGRGLKNADMNGDGVVNDDDYPILIQYLVEGNDLPFFEPKENVVKIEYYALGKLEANEYLISVPDGVEIEWNGEYQFADNSVIYDIDLFKLPNDFNEYERFKGWYLDEQGETEFDITEPITGTTKLYAIFDMDFTVIYDGNGATSGLMDTSVFTIGETSNLIKNTYIREGYKFVGWSEAPEDSYIKYEDEGEIVIPLSFLVTEKTPYIVYAVWEKEIVLGDATGDGEIDGRDGTKVLRHIMELEELTEEQIIAADVNLDDEVDYVDYLIIMKKDAGYIQSLPYDSGEKYTISYDLDGGSGELGIELFPTEYAQISLPMALPKLVKEGYVFTGWTGSNGDIPQTEVTIEEGTTGDLEYTANWELAE